MESVIFSSPILIILFSLAIIALIIDIIFKKTAINIICKISCALLFATGLIFSILFGASFQEIIIVNLLLLVILLFSFYRRKENNNGI